VIIAEKVEFEFKFLSLSFKVQISAIMRYSLDFLATYDLFKESVAVVHYCQDNVLNAAEHSPTPCRRNSV